MHAAFRPGHLPSVFQNIDGFLRIYMSRTSAGGAGVSSAAAATVAACDAASSAGGTESLQAQRFKDMYTLRFPGQSQ